MSTADLRQRLNPIEALIYMRVCACAGDGKAAKELSTRAHAEQKSRDDANRKAAAAIFRHQNPKGADGLRCDLHGLHKVSTNTYCFVAILLGLMVGHTFRFGGGAQRDRTKRCISWRSTSV